MLPCRSLRRLFGLLLLTMAGPLLGQSNDEIQTGTQLELSTPGARSLALGAFRSFPATTELALDITDWGAAAVSA